MISVFSFSFFFLLQEVKAIIAVNVTRNKVCFDMGREIKPGYYLKPYPVRFYIFFNISISLSGSSVMIPDMFQSISCFIAVVSSTVQA